MTKSNKEGAEMTNNEKSIQNYYGLVLLVEAKDTNPQGDPDQDNRPRRLPDGHGLIRAAGIKRKIRDYLSLLGENIFVAHGACLERQCNEVAKENGMNPVGKKDNAEISKIITEKVEEKYFDIRAFGQLLTRPNSKIRGPIQITDGISIDPIEVNDFTLTRCCVADEEAAKKQQEQNQTMGSASTVRYGLYRFNILVNPHDAFKTGYSEEDHEKFLNALLCMFQNDTSSCRNLIIKHLVQYSWKKYGGKDGKELVYAPMNHVLDCVEVTSNGHPSSFKDYVVTDKKLEKVKEKSGLGIIDLLQKANEKLGLE